MSASNIIFRSLSVLTDGLAIGTSAYWEGYVRCPRQSKPVPVSAAVSLFSNLPKVSSSYQACYSLQDRYDYLSQNIRISIEEQAFAEVSRSSPCVYLKSANH